MDEPTTAAPRPCSTPHSAPAAWLKAAPAEPAKYDPGILPAAHASDPRDAIGDAPAELTPEEQRRRDIDDFLATCERIAPAQERRDGWSPFLRKLFLQVIAEGGTISAACEYTGMSRSSAYALEARDRVFAAGLAAAAFFARNPLADDFYEKAKHGITETVTRSDGVTVTRHRFDTRLSVAVLNRLDRRCDRAEERGSVHMAAVRNWDEFLSLVGDGNHQGAEALLDRPVPGSVEGAQQRPTCPLPERANPIPAPVPPGIDLFDNCWKAGSPDGPHRVRPAEVVEGSWLTTFPPPPGFDGYHNIPWDGDNWHERSCTAEEAALLDAYYAAAAAEEQAELAAYAEAERDNFFAGLARAVAASKHAPADLRGAPLDAAIVNESPRPSRRRPAGPAGS